MLNEIRDNHNNKKNGLNYGLSQKSNVFEQNYFLEETDTSKKSSTCEASNPLQSSAYFSRPRTKVSKDLNFCF